MADKHIDWMNKLENKIDTVSIEFTRGIAEIATKLDIYLNRQNDHEERLAKLERHRNKQQGIHDESIRKVHQMTLGVLAITAIIVGAGVYISYVINH